jgi:hypothetical protein
MSSTHSLAPYIDVVLVMLAAPLLFVIGVPTLGYVIGAGSWIVFRAVGVAVDRHASAGANVLRQLSLRIEYRLARVLALVAAAVFALKAGRADGLTALLVITFAFTVQLISLLCDGRGHSEPPASTPRAVPGQGQAPGSLRPPT